MLQDVWPKRVWAKQSVRLLEFYLFIYFLRHIFFCMSVGAQTEGYITSFFITLVYLYKQIFCKAIEQKNRKKKCFVFFPPTIVIAIFTRNVTIRHLYCVRSPIFEHS